MTPQVFGVMVKRYIFDGEAVMAELLGVIQTLVADTQTRSIGIFIALASLQEFSSTTRSVAGLPIEFHHTCVVKQPPPAPLPLHHHDHIPPSLLPLHSPAAIFLTSASALFSSLPPSFHFPPVSPAFLLHSLSPPLPSPLLPSAPPPFSCTALLPPLPSLLIPPIQVQINKEGHLKAIFVMMVQLLHSTLETLRALSGSTLSSAVDQHGPLGWLEPCMSVLTLIFSWDFSDQEGKGDAMGALSVSRGEIITPGALWQDVLVCLPTSASPFLFRALGPDLTIVCRFQVQPATIDVFYTLHSLCREQSNLAHSVRQCLVDLAGQRSPH